MNKNEFFYSIKAAEKGHPFYNAIVGTGSIYAESLEEAKEEGKRILSLPQVEKEEVIKFNQLFRNAKEPFRLRMEIVWNGKNYYIHENNNQSKKDMSKKREQVNDYFNSVMGVGEASQVENEQAAATQEPVKRGKGRPREDGYESRTFRVKKEHVQKLKLIALKEGRLQKDILDFALESIISRYEEKHGALNVDFEQENIETLF